MNNEILKVCPNRHLIKDKQMSFTEISNVMGLSYQQTKQIYKEAIYKMGLLVKESELVDLGKGLEMELTDMTYGKGGIYGREYC